MIAGIRPPMESILSVKTINSDINYAITETQKHHTVNHNRHEAGLKMNLSLGLISKPHKRLCFNNSFF